MRFFIVALTALLLALPGIGIARADVNTLDAAPTVAPSTLINGGTTPAPTKPTTKPRHVLPTKPTHPIHHTRNPAHVAPGKQGGHSTGPSTGGHYTNVDGVSVHRPMHSGTKPAGACAKCGDGTYSFAQHHRGACSHHGGVAVWY
jgi:hypothetical protein